MSSLSVPHRITWSSSVSLKKSYLRPPNPVLDPPWDHSSRTLWHPEPPRPPHCPGRNTSDPLTCPNYSGCLARSAYPNQTSLWPPATLPAGQSCVLPTLGLSEEQWQQVLWIGSIQEPKVPPPQDPGLNQGSKYSKYSRHTIRPGCSATGPGAPSWSRISLRLNEKVSLQTSDDPDDLSWLIRPSTRWNDG